MFPLKMFDLGGIDRYVIMLFFCFFLFLFFLLFLFLFLILFLAKSALKTLEKEKKTLDLHEITLHRRSTMTYDVEKLTDNDRQYFKWIQFIICNSPFSVLFFFFDNTTVRYLSSFFFVSSSSPLTIY